MTNTGKYLVFGSEGEFQQGSNNQVLKNRLGITDPEEMAEVETDLLLKLYEYIFERDLPSSLSTEIIQNWHRWWLGQIYTWAGNLRSVNMSKPDIDFAGAQYLAKLFESFNGSYLQQYSSLISFDDEKLFRYLAESHVEFILIHPFREGNGRISRLLMDVMATKAGYGPLDYSLWDEHKEFYFRSIQAGRDKDYTHMTRLVRDIIQ